MLLRLLYFKPIAAEVLYSRRLLFLLRQNHRITNAENRHPFAVLRKDLPPFRQPPPTQQAVTARLFEHPKNQLQAMAGMVWDLQKQSEGALGSRRAIVIATKKSLCRKNGHGN